MRSVIEFLRILFERRKENVTLLMLEDERPNNPEHYTIRPQYFFTITISAIVAILMFVFLILYITPIGNMMFDTDEAEVRAEIIEITHRIMALQDSLYVRDSQLASIKSVLAEGRDTTFTIQNVDHLEQLFPLQSGSEARPARGIGRERSEMENLNSEHIIFSNIFKQAPQFPAQVPLQGTLTQSFDSGKGHYGIDIAARTGSPIAAVADGVVINGDWTVNYGYVIHIQHGGGYVTTYKHLSNVLLREGDLVMKGDIIGSVGRSGFLASAPHLHFEIWQDGVPLDPASFLINL